MVLNVHRNHKAYQGRGQAALYDAMIHCHHQNDYAAVTRMGSDESQFNVSLIVRGKVTRHLPQTPTFEEKGEPKPGMEPKPSVYQPNALPLGQAGSQ